MAYPSPTQLLPTDIYNPGGPSDTGYGDEYSGRYGYVDPYWSAGPTNWQEWIGNSTGTWEYTGDIFNLFNAGRTGVQQTSWKPKEAKYQIDYLKSVSAVIGKPDFDWLPYLQASQDSHKSVYGIPWSSERSSNWAAATNDVLARAGMSQYQIAPDKVNAVTQQIEQENSPVDGWLNPLTGFLIVATAGAAAGAIGLGAAGAEAAGAGIGAAEAAGAMGGAAGAAGGGLTAFEAAGVTGAAAGGAAGATGAGAMDIWDLYGAGSSAVDPFSAYTAGSPDVIGEFTNLLNSGMSGQDAVTALEQSIPGSTQTAAEFYMNNPSQLFRDLLPKVGEQAAKSMVSSLFSGNAGATDWAKILGTLGATALGAYGANKQASAFEDLANKYQEYGAPSRARYEAAMTPGFDPLSMPGYKGALDTSSQSILAGLSATGGNPYGNPGGLIDANKKIVAGTALPAIQEYTRQNANVGFGSSMNAAQNFQSAGVGADANMFNALGYGLNQVVNPQPSLMDLARAFGIKGVT